DADDPFTAVRRLTSALAPGSFLAVSHGASDLDEGVAAGMAKTISPLMAETVTARSHDEVARFFTGLQLIDPGRVPVTQWRPRVRPGLELRDGGRVGVTQWRPGVGGGGAGGAAMWAGVARKHA